MENNSGLILAPVVRENVVTGGVSTQCHRSWFDYGLSILSKEVNCETTGEQLSESYMCAVHSQTQCNTWKVCALSVRVCRHFNVPSPLKEADDTVFLIALTRSLECSSPGLPDNNNILTDLSWVQVKFNATQGTAKLFPFFPLSFNMFSNGIKNPWILHSSPITLM